jgi:steroid 5-alpha reductase family enzyme
MLQEFFPILEGAPMGDLWILLTWAFLFMIVWMLLVWIWQWKRKASGMDQFGWTSGLAMVAILYAMKGDGYGPRRLMIGTLALLSSGFLARRSWVLAEPSEPVGLKGLLMFEVRTFQAVFLSLPLALLSIDPLASITLYEWVGLLIWVVGLVGQIVAQERQSFYEWLVWVGYFFAALNAPYGTWTFLCPLLMLVLLRPFRNVESEEIPSADA